MKHIRDWSIIKGGGGTKRCGGEGGKSSFTLIKRGVRKVLCPPLPLKGGGHEKFYVLTRDTNVLAIPKVGGKMLHPDLGGGGGCKQIFPFCSPLPKINDICVHVCVNLCEG